jgi:hypothetical protein
MCMNYGEVCIIFCQDSYNKVYLQHICFLQDNFRIATISCPPAICHLSTGVFCLRFGEKMRLCVFLISVLLAYFPCFEKIKGGL